MNLPMIVFGSLLAVAYASAYHLWKGGKLRRLIAFLILSLAGFWLGHLAGSAFKLTFASIGDLHAGLATLGSALFLFVGDWLSLVNIERK